MKRINIRKIVRNVLLEQEGGKTNSDLVLDFVQNEGIYRVSQNEKNWFYFNLYKLVYRNFLSKIDPQLLYALLEQAKKETFG